MMPTVLHDLIHPFIFISLDITTWIKDAPYLDGTFRDMTSRFLGTLGLDAGIYAHIARKASASNLYPTVSSVGLK